MLKICLHKNSTPFFFHKQIASNSVVLLYSFRIEFLRFFRCNFCLIIVYTSMFFYSLIFFSFEFSRSESLRFWTSTKWICRMRRPHIYKTERLTCAWIEKDREKEKQRITVCCEANTIYTRGEQAFEKHRQTEIMRALTRYESSYTVHNVPCATQHTYTHTPIH